ncbi:hypothetical protein RMATCC62417_08059 [Rhizopus microsporus]|nr:hypothetical protein RMATCC62417_08059 [Rhizopus microsporus]
MEINPQDSEKDKTRQSQGSNVNYAVVANPVLVEPTAEDETTEDTDTNEAQSIVVLSRMDVIFQKRMAEGLTIEDVDFLMQSRRGKKKKTHKAYDHGWHENAHLSAPTLNVYRFSIASVFNIIHEDKRYIAEDPLIVSFFQAKRKPETKIPTIGKQEIWDIQQLIAYVRGWGPNACLGLAKLQKKTIIWIGIAAMMCPRLDLGRIQCRDIDLS